MKTVKKGRKQQGWAKEFACTGAGNGKGGCEALLLVEAGDLFRTENTCRDETDYFVTFICRECGVLTDINGWPGSVRDLPDRAEWQRRQNLVDGGWG